MLKRKLPENFLRNFLEVILLACLIFFCVFILMAIFYLAKKLLEEGYSNVLFIIAGLSSLGVGIIISRLHISRH